MKILVCWLSSLSFVGLANTTLVEDELLCCHLKVDWCLHWMVMGVSGDSVTFNVAMFERFSLNVFARLRNETSCFLIIIGSEFGCYTVRYTIRR